ncbi:MAG: PQQ-binding-like beta-propeller repeat protein, partial [Mycobacteriales bacterium]
AAPCAASSTAGGEWRSYGHDLSNSRTQPAETALGTTAAAGLAPVWSADVAPAGPSGQVPATSLNSTPVVADGCVFVGGADGHVVALDAGTGAVVWRSAQLGDPATAGLGGLVVGSVVVDGGRVIVLVNQSDKPFAVALDEHTGTRLWQSPPVSTYPGSYTNASPVLYDGMLLVGFSAPEGDPKGTGGIALLAEDDGRVLKVTDTVPAADLAKGFAGGGIWSAPAVDAATGFAYVATGNPSSKQMEHRNTNAILKLDLHRGPGFGAIVAAYKGNVDQYELSQLTHTPVCAASEGTPLDTFPLDDPACGQLDLDFGASPSLFRDAFGNELVGDLQKSGYFHAAFADTMERAWSTPIGAPCAVCNADSPAVAGGSILAVGTPGGVLASLGQGTGVLGWVSPVADGVHYGSVSEADGVAYTVDTTGCLDAFDAATGVPLLRRPMTADSGQPIVGITSAGVAIAYHTVFVEAGGSVIAYRAGTTLP